MFNKISNLIKSIFAPNGMGGYHEITLSIYDSEGNLKSVDKEKNLIPNEGLIEFLKIINGQSTATSRFIGLGTATYSPVATETAATVAISVGEWVGYSENARPQWVIPSITTNTVDSNASPALFTSNSTATVKTVFLISDSTKGGTAGKLLSVVTLSSPRQLVPGDTIKINYGLTLISQ